MKILILFTSILLIGCEQEEVKTNDGKYGAAYNFQGNINDLEGVTTKKK